jgi:UDP-N-acetylmuramate--alanine ligase
MNIYFLGIGGIGMSALARYFKAKGYRVAGYDRVETPLTRQLQAEGMEIHYEDSVALIPENYRNPANTLVVFTPAVPDSLEELAYFTSNGFQILKRSQALGEITRMQRALCIAGTHGKTTTSSMTAHLLHRSHVDCNAFLGGIAKNFKQNLHLSDKSDLVVVEADEYDRSFLALSPYMAVITAIDADHLDIYQNEEAYRAAFAEFTSRIQPGGALLLKKGVQLTPQLQNGVSLFTYSATEEADFYARNIQIENGEITFDFVTPPKTDCKKYANEVKKSSSLFSKLRVFLSSCLRVNNLRACAPLSKHEGTKTERHEENLSPLTTPQEVITGIKLGVPVKINIENGVAAMALAWLNGAEPDEIRNAMATFAGVNRRFDFQIKRDDFVFIDDYAHHPQELNAFIESLRMLYPTKKICGIFQPHLYSRTRDFADEFAQSLSLLDELILLPIYPAREEPIEGVSSQLLLDKVNIAEKRVLTKEELIEYVGQRKFEVLATIGAGDIEFLIPKIRELCANGRECERTLMEKLSAI